jgi:hypothetical protein
MAAIARLIKGPRVESNSVKGTNPNAPKKTKTKPTTRPSKGRS